MALNFLFKLFVFVNHTRVTFLYFSQNSRKLEHFITLSHIIPLETLYLSGWGGQPKTDHLSLKNPSPYQQPIKVLVFTHAGAPPHKYPVFRVLRRKVWSFTDDMNARLFLKPTGAHRSLRQSYFHQAQSAVLIDGSGNPLYDLSVQC